MAIEIRFFRVAICHVLPPGPPAGPASITVEVIEVSGSGVAKFMILDGSRRPVEPQQPLKVVVPADVIALNVSELVFPSPMGVTAERKGNSVIPSAQYRFHL